MTWRLSANLRRSACRWLAARVRLGAPGPVHGPPATLPRIGWPYWPSSGPFMAQRQMAALHHLLDMSIAEIADATGTPAGTVKVRLSRAAGLSVGGSGPAAGRAPAGKPRLRAHCCDGPARSRHRRNVDPRRTDDVVDVVGRSDRR